MCAFHRRGTVLTTARRLESLLGVMHIAAAWLGLLVPATAPGMAQVVRVTGPQLQVGVDKTSGRLVELVDLVSKRNLVGACTNLGGLWELDTAGTGTLSPTNARALDISPLAKEPAGLQLQWSRFALEQAPKLCVEVTVRMDTNSALSRWQIAVQQAGGLELRAIRFPRMLGVRSYPKEQLSVPVWLGLQANNPRALLAHRDGQPRRIEWQYPGLLSMQCLALNSEGGSGLYAACDDRAGYLKRFAVFGGDDGALNIEIVHQPEGQGGFPDRYVLPYSAVLGAFHGDWFGAAALYRSWATNQPWARNSRLRLGLVPPWTTNTALWVWNRGASPGVIDPAIVLQKELGLPVSVFWHWWHGCAYDAGFPEYLPPREGAAPFKAALQRAHEHDVHAIVYMNQRLWGMTTASWTNENAIRFAVKAADGRVNPEVYNTFTRSPCASMCMGTKFWRNKYAGLATETFRRLGVDGIYMDQACSSLPCFDPGHGHAPGGGKYWMAGFQLLAADIRRHCDMRVGPALAGEGCGENWLPYLDLMLALQVSRERYAAPDNWETIPFFHAVYHGYGLSYGNYSSLTMPPYDGLWPAEFAPKEPLRLLDRKFSQQFCLEQARAFVWGQQPTVANFLPAQLRERSEEMAFVLRLARLRKQALNYLQDGVMLSPPGVEAPHAEIPISRLSIYAGQQGGLTEFRKSVPLALAAAWRAPDGSVGVAVASIADQALKPTLSLDAAAWGLPKRGRIFRLHETGRKRAGEFLGETVTVTPDLPPRGACVLELTAD